MPDPCTCKVVGCLCRREVLPMGSPGNPCPKCGSIVNDETETACVECGQRFVEKSKCSGCKRGEHADSRGRVLCHHAVCRSKTIVATHRVLFTEGQQPLCCKQCSGEWIGNGVPTWPLDSDSERQREKLLAALAEFYSEADALKWVQSRHPQIPGTALVMHLLGTVRAPEVFAVVDQMRSGAHV